MDLIVLASATGAATTATSELSSDAMGAAGSAIMSNIAVRLDGRIGSIAGPIDPLLRTLCCGTVLNGDFL